MGYDVLKEIEILNLDVKVILMSGVEQTPLETETSSDVEFMQKPFSLGSVTQFLKMKDKHAYHKILVVDDEGMLRDMLREFLDGHGYEIVVANNGRECIENTQKHRFDAIFMDVRMPEMDGLEALQRLRKEGIQTPVILMSGFGDVSSVEEAKQRGAQNFLPKPFRLETALQMLRE